MNNRIPFDIKYKPQIESGEYKVETECGHPVSIMDWEWIDRDEKKCLAVKVLKDDGYNVGYLFDYDGKRYSIFPKGGDSDLFLITPEPEMSEFEKAVGNLLIIAEGRDHYEGQTEHIKKVAAEFLTLARKELEPEVLERLEIAYKNQDEVVYENGKREGKAEALKEIEQDPESSYAFKRGVEYGKEEALKDLPRWRKWENGVCGNGQGIPIAIVKHWLSGYKLVDAIGIQGEQYIMLSDLEKLPGFND